MEDVRILMLMFLQYTYISEEINIKIVKIRTTCQKSRMLVPEFGLLRY